LREPERSRFTNADKAIDKASLLVWSDEPAIPINNNQT